MSESFDKVFAEIRREYASVYSIGTLARLQIAHEHDMELADKSAYHRGFEDGQRSMDAEHRAVAMRLQRLRLDEGSHENLSAIARAIWRADFGWTQGACEGLRDELIRLLGGVHEPVPVAADCDADCDDCHRRDGEAGRIAKLKQQRDEYKTWYEEYYDAYSRSVDDYNAVLLDRNELKLKLLEIKAIINASDKAHRDA